MENGLWDSALTHYTAEPTDAFPAREMTEWGDPLFIGHWCQLGKQHVFPAVIERKESSNTHGLLALKIQSHAFFSSLSSTQTELQVKRSKGVRGLGVFF